MQSYEQSLCLFTGWLEEEGDVQKVSEIKEMTIRRYILKLLSRGKYAVSADARTRLINHPENRGDYSECKIIKSKSSYWETSLLSAHVHQEHSEESAFFFLGFKPVQLGSQFIYFSLQLYAFHESKDASRLIILLLKST